MVSKLAKRSLKNSKKRSIYKVTKRKNIKKSKKTKRSKKIKRSKRSKKSLKEFCRNKLSNKIRINMKELKSGSKRIKSQSQAIAVSYSQIKKKFPKCSRSLKRKNI